MGTVLGRVLVIDDDPFMLRAICDLLQRAGFQVVVQETAAGATRVIERERIDAAVIDWNLPRLQGDEVVRLLRSWEELRELPILLVTGAPDDTVERIREQLPGVRVMSKEHLRDELVAVLGSVLASNKTVRGMRPVQLDSEGEFTVAQQQRRASEELVADLLGEIGELLPSAAEVWRDATNGQLERVGTLVKQLERLSGQAHLLALEEAASLLAALASTLRAIPPARKVPRDVRRPVERGLAALSALTSGESGAFSVSPDRLIGALQRARDELAAS